MSDPRVLPWLGLSLIFAAYYGWLGLQAAYDGDFVLQDDARLHVSWMLRFVDPELLRDDLIADYFESVSPAGFTALYRLAWALGIHPFDFSKVLPPVLGLITAAYCFRFALLLLPVPAAAFAASLLLTQSLWMKTDLVSGTPRAFVYVLLLAFLCAFHQRRSVAMLISIGLQALIYPLCAILSSGVLALSLLRVRGWRLHLSDRREDFWFAASGIALAAVLLGVFALQISDYGPAVTAAEARAMPEFQSDGRIPFFQENLFAYWTGSKAGPLPHPVMTPVTLLFALGFPFVLARRKRFPLLAGLPAQSAPMLLLLLASLGAFVLAHLVLFKLHGPGRYGQHSLRILFALAAAFTIFALADRVLAWAGQAGSGMLRRGLALAFALSLAIALMGYSLTLKRFPVHDYIRGGHPGLYAFLLEQPKDTLIASLVHEADNLPSFAERSVLVSREYGIPFHKEYYGRFRERVLDVVTAQYTNDPQVLRATVEKYGIDLWLLEGASFHSGYFESNEWLMQFQPAVAEAASKLGAGEEPSLTRYLARCTVFEGDGFHALDAGCILKSIPARRGS